MVIIQIKKKGQFILILPFLVHRKHFSIVVSQIHKSKGIYFSVLNYVLLLHQDFLQNTSTSDTKTKREAAKMKKVLSLLKRQ